MGQSLGDFLLAVLDEMVVGWSIEPELRPGPAPTPAAGYKESVEVCALKQAAGQPPSAVLKFGMTKGMAGSPESSPKASEERAKTNRGIYQ